MHYLRRNRRVSHYRSTNILTAIPGVDRRRKYSSRLLRREFRLQFDFVYSTWFGKVFIAESILWKELHKEFVRPSFHINNAYFHWERHLDAPTRSVSSCSDNVRSMVNATSFTHADISRVPAARSRNLKVFDLGLYRNYRSQHSVGAHRFDIVDELNVCDNNVDTYNIAYL